MPSIIEGMPEHAIYLSLTNERRWNVHQNSILIVRKIVDSIINVLHHIILYIETIVLKLGKVTYNKSDHICQKRKLFYSKSKNLRKKRICSYFLSHRGSISACTLASHDYWKEVRRIREYYIQDIDNYKQQTILKTK